MKQLLNELPLPSVGLMLALAALGNLLGPYHPALKTLCGSLSAGLLLFITLKGIFAPGSVKEGLAHPVVGGVLCTYPMGIMILSTYLKPYASGMAFALWMGAIALHLVMLALFSKRFLLGLRMENVFPSFFIVYVGFVVGSVTAPAYGMQTAGKALFAVGLVNLLWLLPIVLKRIRVLGIKMPPAKPTLAILAAPASLCLAGYLNSFEDKSLLVVVTLLAVSFTLYAYVLSQLPGLLKLPYFPSYSAFTFPLVISAVAFKGAGLYIAKATGKFAFLSVFANLWVFIAAAMTFYVFLRYAQALLIKEPARR